MIRKGLRKTCVKRGSFGVTIDASYLELGGGRRPANHAGRVGAQSSCVAIAALALSSRAVRLLLAHTMSPAVHALGICARVLHPVAAFPLEAGFALAAETVCRAGFRDAAPAVAAQGVCCIADVLGTVGPAPVRIATAGVPA